MAFVADGNTFNFIVVGGGTAGNAVAGRLAKNPHVRVLVVEAGIPNPDQIEEITTPSKLSLLGAANMTGLTRLP